MVCTDSREEFVEEFSLIFLSESLPTFFDMGLLIMFLIHPRSPSAPFFSAADLSPQPLARFPPRYHTNREPRGIRQ
jgi:hypothetical protein